jgi:hypothetical protein
VWKAGCVTDLRRLSRGIEGVQSANFLPALENVFPPTAVVTVFFVEAYPVLSDNPDHKQSSAVASVLAQEMLYTIKICWADLDEVHAFDSDYFSGVISGETWSVVGDASKSPF